MDVGNLPNLKQSVFVLEQALKDRDFGETFTFDQLDKMADLDVRKYRSVLESVKKSMLKHHGKLFINLRGIGYRICKPGEYHVAAGSYRRKAGRSLKKGSEILSVADLSAMSEEDKIRTIKEAGKNQLLLIATKIASKEKLSSKIDYSRPPSEESIIKFLLDKSSTTQK
jgi:hypothetical protein